MPETTNLPPQTRIIVRDGKRIERTELFGGGGVIEQLAKHVSAVIFHVNNARLCRKYAREEERRTGKRDYVMRANAAGHMKQARAAKETLTR